MRDNDLPVGEITVLLTSLLVNLAIAIVLFLVLSGRALTSRRIDPDDRKQASEERYREARDRPGA